MYCFLGIAYCKEKFEDIKGKAEAINQRTDTEKGQALIYKTLHRKLKIEQHEPHQEQDVNSSWFLSMDIARYCNVYF